MTSRSRALLLFVVVLCFGVLLFHAATWLRVLPDLVFDVGAVALLSFVVRAIALDLALRRGERTKGRPGLRRAA